jgi:hypothetical protein
VGGLLSDPPRPVDRSTAASRDIYARWRVPAGSPSTEPGPARVLRLPLRLTWDNAEDVPTAAVSGLGSQPES